MKNTLDLNLLQTLTLLYRYKKLKVVAQKLDKSTASVSKYLSRMREQFQDELFTLSADGYEPTVFMSHILPELEEGLTILEHTLEQREFNPSHYQKEIIIALSPFAQQFIGHLLINEVKAAFPNAPLRLTSLYGNIERRIQDEEIDIAVYFFNNQLPKSIYQKAFGAVDISIVVPEHLAINSLKECLTLPFFLPDIPEIEEYYQVYEQALKGIKNDVRIVGYINNVSCLFNTITAQNAATIINTPPTSLTGFTSFKLANNKHSAVSCALMKSKYRHAPLQKKLFQIMEKIYPYQ